jgi:hypothetical protein
MDSHPDRGSHDARSAVVVVLGWASSNEPLLDEEGGHEQLRFGSSLRGSWR